MWHCRTSTVVSRNRNNKGPRVGRRQPRRWSARRGDGSKLSRRRAWNGEGLGLAITASVSREGVRSGPQREVRELPHAGIPYTTGILPRFRKNPTASAPAGSLCASAAGSPTRVGARPLEALIVNSAKGSDVGCGEQSEPHQTRRAEAMRFVPHRILRRCRAGSGRGYNQGPA
jgi:hypothetical protein